jgi:hypothetical protein
MSRKEERFIKNWKKITKLLSLKNMNFYIIFIIKFYTSEVTKNRLASVPSINDLQRL